MVWFLGVVKSTPRIAASREWDVYSHHVGFLAVLCSISILRFEQLSSWYRITATAAGRGETERAIDETNIIWRRSIMGLLIQRIKAR
jgi:hypothetical protein